MDRTKAPPALLSTEQWERLSSASLLPVLQGRKAPKSMSISAPRHHCADEETEAWREDGLAESHTATQRQSLDTTRAAGKGWEG